MKSVIEHPLVRLFTTFVLSVMLVAPFVNNMVKPEYVDSVVVGTYSIVAGYLMVKQLYDIFIKKS